MHMETQSKAVQWNKKLMKCCLKPEVVVVVGEELVLGVIAVVVKVVAVVGKVLNRAVCSLRTQQFPSVSGCHRLAQLGRCLCFMLFSRTSLVLTVQGQ